MPGQSSNHFSRSRPSVPPSFSLLPSPSQEAGNSRAKQCLKYAALSNILANSSINPFAATEAKVYQVMRVGAGRTVEVDS